MPPSYLSAIALAAARTSMESHSIFLGVIRSVAPATETAAIVAPLPSTTGAAP